MNIKYYLETDRLILRNLCNEDIYKIYDYRNNINCYKYQKWENTSMQSLKDFVTQFYHSNFLSLEKEQHYAICLKNNEIIGDLSYFYTEEDQCITLGYTISYKYQRNGYAFEILSLLVDKIKKFFPHLDIVALVDYNNIPSINLLKKLGFYEECYVEQIKSYIYVIDGKKDSVL